MFLEPTTSSTTTTETTPAECNQLPNVPFGAVSNGSNGVGDFRDIQCNSGFQINGPSRIFCMSNLSWSNPGKCQS